MLREQYRQGDVVLEKEKVNLESACQCRSCAGVNTFEAWGVNSLHSRGTAQRHAVALGEKTGHEHVLEAEQEFELFEKDGTLYMRLPAEAKLTHPEHAPIAIPAGEYRVVRQQEYDPKLGRRPVLD